jgi:hypothetical protein
MGVLQPIDGQGRLHPQKQGSNPGEIFDVD